MRLAFIVGHDTNNQYCNNFTLIVGHVSNSKYCNSIGLPSLSAALQTVNIATMLQRHAFTVSYITNNEYYNNTIDYLYSQAGSCDG